MTFVRFVACAMALAWVGGCATIIRGTKQDFTVQTDPPGASALLSTGESCPATPCTFERSRNEPFTVTVSMPGYVTETHEIRNPWSRQGTTTGIVGNAILGGGIGIGVDAATGANRDLTPNPLVVTLTEEKPEEAAAETQTVDAAVATEVSPEAPPAEAAETPEAGEQN